MLLGHDPCRGFVLDAGWPVVEYGAWAFRTLVRQLLARTRLLSGACSDLSFADWLARV